MGHDVGQVGGGCRDGCGVLLESLLAIVSMWCCGYQGLLHAAASAAAALSAPTLHAWPVLAMLQWTQSCCGLWGPPPV